jgi:hypothetical protein
MTKLAEIQAAIVQLDPLDQDKLRIWMDEAPLDLEEDTPELEAELLKGVRSEHTPYSSAEMRGICERILEAHRVRQRG